MKTFGVCAVGGAVAFLVMSFQMGLFEPGRPSAAEPTRSEQTADQQPNEPLPFPDGLYPACRGKPVAAAAAFKRGAAPHPVVFLRTSGGVHSWQEYVPTEWSTERVERAQLVVLLPPQRKILIEKVTYPNGAPPVSRFTYELDAHVIEARTGKVVARKRFITIPRPVRPIESWELTALGEPVRFREVFDWVVAQTRGETPAQVDSDSQ